MAVGPGPGEGQWIGGCSLEDIALLSTRPETQEH